jgi:hypothetical protein
MPGHASPTDLLYAGIEQLDVARVQEALDRGANPKERAYPYRQGAGALPFSALFRTTIWDQTDYEKALAIENVLLVRRDVPVKADQWNQRHVLTGVTQAIFDARKFNYAPLSACLQRMERWLQHPEIVHRPQDWACACVNAWEEALGEPTNRYAHWHSPTMMELAQHLAALWTRHGLGLHEFRLPLHDQRMAAVLPLMRAAQRAEQADAVSPERPRQRRRS